MFIWIWQALLISLILTVIMEIGFSLAVRVWNKKDLLLVLLVNVLTNPFVVFTYHAINNYTNMNPNIVKVVLEILVVVVEARYYAKYAIRITHPYIFSISCNAFSFVMGLILFRI